MVFNTAMSGYPESLTDPSYAGQLLTLTYPLVGNYGVPPFTVGMNRLPTFMESERIMAHIIVSDYSENYSHWNSAESLGDWLKREQVPGITRSIDTRELTKVLRRAWSDVRKNRLIKNQTGKMKNQETDEELPTAVYKA